MSGVFYYFVFFLLVAAVPLSSVVCGELISGVGTLSNVVTIWALGLVASFLVAFLVCFFLRERVFLSLYDKSCVERVSVRKFR